MPHIQNVQVNKDESAKQVSEAGNCDVPRRPFRQNNTLLTLLTSYHTQNISKPWISSQMRCTSWLWLTVHNRSDRLELHCENKSSDRYFKIPDYLVELLLELNWELALKCSIRKRGREKERKVKQKHQDRKKKPITYIKVSGSEQRYMSTVSVIPLLTLIRMFSESGLWPYETRNEYHKSS